MVGHYLFCGAYFVKEILTEVHPPFQMGWVQLQSLTSGKEIFKNKTTGLKGLLGAAPHIINQKMSLTCNKEFCRINSVELKRSFFFENQICIFEFFVA